MIVMAIVIVLLLLLFIGLRIQITRGYDSRRKTDLFKIRRAYEEYYNDHDCYPPATILDTCGSADLSPYLPAVPCDPIKKTPYKYVPVAGNVCSGYAACVSLGDLNDPDIEKIGCNPVTGCGWGDGFNYCIASGIPILAPGFDPLAGATNTPTPSASPTPVPGQYGCQPGSPVGQCNNYGVDIGLYCDITFASSNCENSCDNPANFCDF